MLIPQNLSMLWLLTFSHTIYQCYDCLHIYQCYDCLHIYQCYDDYIFSQNLSMLWLLTYLSMLWLLTCSHRIYQCYDCLHIYQCYDCLHFLTESINARTAYIFSQNLSMLGLLTYLSMLWCLHFLPVGRIQITGCFARPPPVSMCRRTGSHLMWFWPQWSSFLG